MPRKEKPILFMERAPVEGGPAGCSVGVSVHRSGARIVSVDVGAGLTVQVHMTAADLDHVIDLLNRAQAVRT